MTRETSYESKKFIKPFKEVESWSSSKKKAYYDTLREECYRRKIKLTGCSWLMAKISPLLRCFPIEVRDEENIPEDTAVVFVGNHSNSHDLFVIKETFFRLKKKVTQLAAWDGLNIFSRMVL